MDLGSLVEAASGTGDKNKSKAKRNYIIEPGKSVFLDRWDMYVAFLLLYVALVTPFEVAFLETTINWMFFVNRLIDLSFILDMGLQFFIAYIDTDTGAWEYSQSRIAVKYMKSWLVIDLISILPFDSVGLMSDSDAFESLKVLRVVRFMRLLKLVKIFAGQERLQIAIAKLGISFAFISLSQMCGCVLLVAHWFACAWYLAATFATDSNNWASTYGYQDASNADKYIVSYYWAIYTMVTIGYGDLGATNVGERIVATVTMMIGGGMYSYIVGSVCGIVEGANRGKTDYTQAMDNLNRYMGEVNVPARTRVQLRLYFVQCKALHADKYNMEVLENMSPGLQRNLAGHMHSSWMKNIRFFVTGTSRDDEFITGVALMMTTLALPVNELLIREGESAATMYIVRRGLVGAHGRVYRKGKFIGDDMIMGSDMKREYRAQCLTFTDVMALSHEDLHMVLGQGFRAHQLKVKSAAAWLSVKKTFLEVGRLMLRIRAVTGTIPEFDCPSDTMLYIRRLREYGGAALMPEIQLRDQLPPNGPQYIVELLKRSENTSTTAIRSSAERGFKKAQKEVMAQLEGMIQRRFQEIADAAVEKISAEIATIATLTTVISSVAIVIGMAIAAPTAVAAP